MLMLIVEHMDLDGLGFVAVMKQEKPNQVWTYITLISNTHFLRRLFQRI
jgi:hypothetical protein